MKGIRITIAAFLSIASMATAVASPSHANTLRWANNADITTVDPHGSYGVFNMGFVGNIYEGLVRLTREYKIEPSLAVSCPANRIRCDALPKSSQRALKPKPSMRSHG